MGNPHVIVVPHPAKGHEIPLMELSRCLAKQGFNITFVNIEFNHRQAGDAMRMRNNLAGQIRLVSVALGLEYGETRNEPGKLIEAIFRHMPRKLQELIEEISASGVGKVACVVADITAAWALEVAKKMGIRLAAFLPAAAAMLALQYSIPKLVDDGVISSHGVPVRNQIIQLSPAMPPIKTESLVWACSGNQTMQKIIFRAMIKNNKALKFADWVICNSVYDLEPAVFDLFPDFLPIGPLLDGSRHLQPEDITCLKWLNQWPPSSVLYIAFGSLTMFNKTQFEELAFGLELSNKPFLWVVRPGSIDKTADAYPEGFRDRLAARGLVVDWAPQQKVLGHPSVACFVSHCGWNSIIEGVSNGVPFLCWPYNGDQFFNETYICDMWMVGLGFNRDKNGIVTREEIRNKLDQLFDDECLKERALNLKEMAMNSVREGGSSNRNFRNFVEWVGA
ncbi:UDP-glycosyltransferase 83A1 isoform X1 [Malania oleifera]|uniref:UDP-glycosyltransferase 83A1 isoform X1 n=1 Tax=Malania oleifera TaxID=397392 RepID=UPI0025AE700E|nr:UDP-glycosyltransferase 83A1 isoform X1 [Malania oleifera]